MIIGKFDFSEKLKTLSLANFKRFWMEGDWEKQTGKTAEEAAVLIGVKLPDKKTKGE
jgi:hypothetical protein